MKKNPNIFSCLMVYRLLDNASNTRIVFDKDEEYFLFLNQILQFAKIILGKTQTH